MSWLFASPWGFWALLSLPALLAIYLLRRRSRRRTVSSLLLWARQPGPRRGGSRVEKPRLPPAFFLELLILALLALAAAAPHLPTADLRRPLAVVLDDSFSMLAGGEDGALAEASAALAEVLSEASTDGFEPVHLVLAGERPQLLQTVTPPSASWRGGAAVADLDAAVALASELAGSRGRLLVLTDRPPPAEGASVNLDEGRLLWRAFGRRASNLSFVNAARTDTETVTRCLVEVANLSAQSQTAKVRVREDGRELEERTLELSPDGVQRLTFDLPEGLGPLTVELPSDELATDNRVVLLPDRQPAVRYRLALADGELKELLGRALDAAGAREGGAAAELVFTEAAAGEAAAGPSPPWQVRFHRGVGERAFLGPFVFDRAHPLAEGLELDGVIWGADPWLELPGVPLLLAGDLPLVTEELGAGGERRWHLRWRPELSTLQRSPAWPVLIWNLVQLRTAARPGPVTPNARLGGVVEVLLPPGAAADEAQEVAVRAPDGEARNLAAVDGRLRLEAARAGVYEIDGDGATYRFASNALDARESDLRGAASGRWGRWGIGEEGWAYRHLGWVPLLLALALLALHAFRVLAPGARP